MAKQTTSKKTNKKAAGSGTTKEKAPEKEKAVAAQVAQKTSVETEKAEKQATTKKSVAKTPDTPEAAANKLKHWYRWFGVVLLIESALVAFLSKNTAAPVTMQYPTVDTLASEANGHQIMNLASRHIADVHLGWMVVTFLAVFGIVFLMLSTVYRAYLELSLRRGVNALRWFGLAAGGGLMVVTIAMVTSIASAELLLALFVSTFLAGMLALGIEVLVANNGGVKSRFARMLCGVAMVAGALPWVVFGLALIGALVWNGHFASYMYSIYACQFLLFVAFVLATHFRLNRRGRWADAAYTERSFVALSFVAATLLALQVFVGLLK